MYDIEELEPFVTVLKKKYAFDEGSSLFMEKADAFEVAVRYCIDQNDDLPSFDEDFTIEDAYNSGLDIINDKFKTAQDMYNDMLLSFNAYYNENLAQAVNIDINRFFSYYDTKFFPHENVINLKYPVLASLDEFAGIDALGRYIKCIDLEQSFMSKFLEIYVIDVLQRYDKEYTKRRYNVCGILLRNILGCMLIDKNPMRGCEKKHYSQLRDVIIYNTPLQLKRKMVKNLQDLIIVKYDGNKELYQYLLLDVDNFARELINGIEYDCLEHAVVL